MPQKSPKISRLFIANRGEICRRIAVSARSMGIETVCLSDRSELPLYLQGLITEFIPVAAENAQLYLDSARLIAYALKARCDAVHPGFGFLSESSSFAAAVRAAGLVWIGPPAEAIAAMASKDGARKIAVAEGVPCPGSYAQAIREPRLTKEISAAAAAIGYPLLVKAAGGGGGKGMRVVERASELASALEQAHHEALNFFADGRLLLEQYLRGARHIEVQILADQQGQVVALGDRDCSLQRRKQKIIEEAPAPRISVATRKAMHGYAIALARAVAYQSAGTVEFLLREGKGSGKDEVFFLEMNTRLQVEHPVTEEVFGLDLVALQLKIAMGYTLPADFSSREPRGHSVEARLYGEDYLQNFAPAPGFVPSFTPCQLPGIRWEVGLDSTDTVTSLFDPMIAKVVVRAASREEALARLGLCLEQSFYSGPASNKEFLIYFTSGPGAALDWCTDTIETHFKDSHLLAELQQRKDAHQVEVAAIFAYLLASPALQGSLAPAQGDNPVSAITRQAFIQKLWTSTNTEVKTEVRSEEACQLLNWGSSQAGSQGETILTARGNFAAGGRVSPWQAAVWRSKGDSHAVLLWRGFEYHERRKAKVWQEEGKDTLEAGQQSAPVPGRIVKVSTRLGAKVHKDDCLFLVESMKMEFEVRATRDGQITGLHVGAGDQVNSGQLLAHIGTPT